MARTAYQRVLGAASAILLAAAAARAQAVHEVVPGGDAVSGAVSSGGEVDRIPVRLPEGALFSVSLKAAKGSALLPAFTLLGPDRQPDPAVAGLLKANSKGNALSLKNLPVQETGLRWIEIRGKDGTTGGWLLTTKIKLPKGATGTPSVVAAQGVTSFEFPVPGNATATVVVAAAKGSPAVPAYGGLVDPAGANVFMDAVVPGKAGFTLKNAILAKSGDYTLALQPGTGGDGAVNVKIKWKIPKPFKRTLLEAQVITDPVLTAVTPAGGNNAQVVPVSVTVDFARSGAKVTFRKPPTVVTAQGAGLTFGPTGITFTQSLASFQKGDYDVEVENTDGGKDVLVKAFTVVNAPATITSITPDSAYDNQGEIRITVTGAFINGGASATLVRGGDSIPGTSVLANASSLSADFDVTGHAIGFYDMVVTNPDAAATTLAAAFEIVNSPPVLASLSPSDNIDGAVVACTIDGTDFDPTPTALLRRTGETDIPGTSVVWVSGTRLTCTFDTSGRAVGIWDLVVANPDLGTDTLPSAFRILGTVAPAAKVLSAGGAADGPPSICWNGTRNEFAVAWVDVNGSNYDVRVQRLDATGSPLGNAASVSSSSTSVVKRDAVVAWDSTNDQYLAVWSEPRAIPTSVVSKHPSYGFYTSVFQVFAQRLQGSNLSPLGGNVQVSNHTTLPTSSGFYMDEFNNFRPDACWDAKGGLWQIVWMQEWDTNGTYTDDDWDVIRQALDPATGNLLSNPDGVSVNSYHEGEPCIAYDSANETYIIAWNKRTSSSANLDGVVQGSPLASDGVDTQDLRMAVDPVAGRLLVTWTKSPFGGAKYVEGGTYVLSSPSTLVGSTRVIGSGNGDHFLARPMYNPSTRQALISWTRKDTSAGLTVRSRRASTGTSSGLTLLGTEMESSSGSTDEAMPVSVYSGTAGESVVLWLKTMTFVSANGYAGSALTGKYTGLDFWMVRYK